MSTHVVSEALTFTFLTLALQFVIVRGFSSDANTDEVATDTLNMLANKEISSYFAPFRFLWLCVFILM